MVQKTCREEVTDMDIWGALGNFIKKTLLTTTGDILRYTAGGIARLARGTTYQVLRVNAGGTDIEWGHGNAIIETNGKEIRMRVVEVGVWDMDLTTQVNIGIPAPTRQGLLGVQVFIRADASVDPIFLAVDNANVIGADVRIASCSGGVLSLVRKPGGVYDSAGYSSVAINRGFILFTYAQTSLY